MQLHMTMEQCHAGIVGDKVHFHFLKTTQHRDILYNAGRIPARDFCYFKTMAVHVHRVNVVRSVAHPKPVSLPCFQMEHRRHIHHIKGHPVDRPAIKSFSRRLLSF